MGRTACSLLMVALKCITKVTMTNASSPAAGDLDLLPMRKSASVLVLITLLLLLACVTVVTFVLPLLVEAVEEAESVAVPPGRLRVLGFGFQGFIFLGLCGGGVAFVLLLLGDAWGGGAQVHCQQCSHCTAASWLQPGGTVTGPGSKC